MFLAAALGPDWTDDDRSAYRAHRGAREDAGWRCVFSSHEAHGDRAEPGEEGAARGVGQRPDDIVVAAGQNVEVLRRVEVLVAGRASGIDIRVVSRRVRYDAEIPQDVARGFERQRTERSKPLMRVSFRCASRARPARAS